MSADDAADYRRFAPHPLARGGHRQTLLGYAARGRLRWTPPVEDLVVEAGQGARLLLRVSWQREPERPLLLLVHGLQGSDASGYVLATGLHAFERGWHVARLNLRGSGDSHSLCPLLYNAGQEGDLLAAAGELAPRAAGWAVCGFSLGGNLALLLAARHSGDLPPGHIASVAVSPPLDLAACAAALARGENRLYQWHFMRQLREGYRSRQRQRPDLYQPGLERAPRTIREYDEAITARYGGYLDAADYYARSSAGPLLASLETPALVLAAADDPMIPAPAVAGWPLPSSGCVERELLESGGHVGFCAPSLAPGRFWAAERVLAYLEARRRRSA